MPSGETPPPRAWVKPVSDDEILATATVSIAGEAEPTVRLALAELMGRVRDRAWTVDDPGGHLEALPAMPGSVHALFEAAAAGHFLTPYSDVWRLVVCENLARAVWRRALEDRAAHGRA